MFARILMVPASVALAVLALGGCSDFGGQGSTDVAVAAGSSKAFGALPEVTLTDARGREVGTARMKGSAWALVPLSRPLRNSTRKLVNTLGDVSIAMEGTDLRLVCVSTDPLTDTPEALAEYANQSGIDNDTWMLWTGSEADTFQLLAGAYGPTLEGWDAERMGDFMKRAFESRAVVIDPEGRVRGAYDLFDEGGPTALLERLRAVARE